MKQLEEILVIEDDLVVSRMHKFNLNRVLQTEVRLFHDGKKGKDYLDSKQPKKKLLVLLDLNMPVMNGWEFLELTKDKCYSENMFVVVVTSSPYKEDIQKAQEYERVLGVYTKPFKKADVLEILELLEAELVAKESSAK